MLAVVTGATGLVGFSIVEALLERGHQVSVLVRDEVRARAILPRDVALHRGDITDEDSLDTAFRGAEWIFHAAGMPEQWLSDPGQFDRVNRGGTALVARAAERACVKRLIHTSTMDVFKKAPDGTLTEELLDPDPKPTAYERSKQAAERELLAVAERGLPCVMLNPSAVFGEGPAHVTLNSLFIDFLNGRVPLAPPGGVSVVHVRGVASAHVAAAERGTPGERYLLADGHTSMRDLLQAIAVETGRRCPPAAPVWLVRVLAALGAPLARLTGKKPMISRDELSLLLWNARVDASRAERELGFVPLPIQEGIRRTVAFLRKEGLVPA